MTVKIVTDSVADLPPQVILDLGITVVPIVVRFGTQLFRDGIDLTAEQFYEKLKSTKDLPVTSVPAPADYISAFEKLAQEADEILVITISAKLSGTNLVALQAKELAKCKCRIEVIDSQWATMAEGFLAIAAAKAARNGATLDEVKKVVEQNISRVDMRATFDTLEYLRRGGRIGAAQAFFGSMLKINPIITLRNGVVEAAGRTRSRGQAIDRLFEFAASYKKIDEMAVGDTACPADADSLTAKLGTIFPKERIYRTKMTPAIGTHTGPGLVLVAIMGDK